MRELTQGQNVAIIRTVIDLLYKEVEAAGAIRGLRTDEEIAEAAIYVLLNVTCSVACVAQMKPETLLLRLQTAVAHYAKNYAPATASLAADQALARVLAEAARRNQQERS